MGCAQSKIENEEAVSRCKDRKVFMKDAVAARNAFAATHSAYGVALKNSGAALSDYGHGEVDSSQNVVGAAAEPAAMDSLPLPPPPLPSFSPVPPPPPPKLHRATTMPAFPVKQEFKHVDTIEEGVENDDKDGGDDGSLRRRRRKSMGNGKMKEVQAGALAPSPPQTPPMNAVPPPPPDSKGMPWDYFFMMDNMPGPSLREVDEIRDQKDENEDGGYGERFDRMNNMGGGGGGGDDDDHHSDEEFHEVEPKTPEKEVEKVEETTPVKPAKQIIHSNTTQVDVRRGSKLAPGVNLLHFLNKIDDHFLRASESAHEVSKMLEATRLHYHSNFADNRGHIDHAARVMRVITWNRSFTGMPNADGGKDDPDSEETETHATILDKLLAWEKKLYDEVKTGELMKLEYQRKVALLTKQRKRGASVESLEKTKAAVSHLHTRYIVDMQSMDSTVSEVNHLRDDELYPKLVALVDGTAKMWETMCKHHNDQLKIAIDLKSLDISQSPKETTKHHHDRTLQLCNAVQDWNLQFDKLVTHQKQYIQALNSWLKLNLVPIESSLKDKIISSPPRVLRPPIQPLVISWHDELAKLPDELAKTAISSFVAVMKTIIIHQEEEMRMKDKCNETEKEYLKKKQGFEEWHQKYMQRKNPHDEMEDGNLESGNLNNPVAEKEFVLESLKKKLEEEVEAHARHCLQVREKSLGSLKTRLPELFRALSDYAHACSDGYNRLRLITQPQLNQNGGVS